MSRRRRLSGTVLIIGVATTFALSSCSWDGVNSLPLPGGQGGGAGAYEVAIEMPDVSTITQNSPVMVDDVTVGRIKSISLSGWHARVTVSLNRDVVLPANAVAAVGQTSLLGSQHIELAPPTDDAPAGRLAAGAVIPLERATSYPTTEQTLTALSVILNDGGLARVGEIVHGANDALAGRPDGARGLLTELEKVTGTLAQRRETIVTALRGLDRLSTTVREQNTELADAIDTVQPALGVLSARRIQLSKVLGSLDRFSEQATLVVNTSGDNLRTNVSNLRPALKGLADSGDSLSRSLDLAFTLPFPLSKVDQVVRGDYANLFLILDFSVPRLREGMLRGTPLGNTLAGPGGVLGRSPGTAGDTSNPITAPVTGAPTATAPPRGR
ncbi:MCE family protein [Williamsia maris]|uniref:Phospholipid/cholesterol/gamma-HCH transport system substrate-binding protein n=1 Tax=Williamsia maris TaxID=72806 RepID=A0ABT1HB72_9NOCA|nr:MCE family protein [Williamsia maris]MCP2175512.1 phospholipid/cholesterol/gamma-HCH transport system substrate-binding protein [Williamsia maris]